MSDIIESPDKWHLDKRLSVSHLITTALLLSGLFVWGAKMEQRIVLMESSIAGMESRIDRSERRYQTDLLEIKAALIRIEEKVNRR